MSERMVLEGIRVLDLSRVWSGPLAVRMLADMGAEVIKVEAPYSRLGMTKEFFDIFKQMSEAGRRFPYFLDGNPGDQPWNRNALYNDLNRNKLTITLDLNKDAGREVFKRLVKISDVVLENYSPRVMENFGLDYKVLSEINPEIIMISMPGYGMTGPYRNYPAYGTSLDQHAGFSSLMGYPDSGPYRTQSTLPDPVASLNGAGAVMLALWHRRKTGKGQFIDLAQIEASTCVTGQATMDYVMNKRSPTHLGNRDHYMAPQGCYRCRGEDMWVAISVASDDEWEAFSRAIGDPSWTKEERFADQLNRWQNQDELDKLIQEWTVKHEHYEVMHLLQKSGIAAAAVLNAEEVVNDPHLRKRGYFAELAHPVAGTHPFPGFPMKLSETPATFRMPAPKMGEHNDYVLHQLLEFSDDEIERLKADNAVIDTISIE